MPITNLGRWTAKQKQTTARRNATRRARAERMTHLQTTHYKRFCDVVFEARIRWRDRWTDTLDGRRFSVGDYEHYHACHYIPRGSLATRYMDENCHGQSSGHNWAMSQAAPALIKDRTLRQYTAFIKRKYGDDMPNKLEQLSRTICHWTELDWIDKARELYQKALAMDGNALEARLAQVYRTFQEKRVLELILEKIKNE